MDYFILKTKDGQHYCVNTIVRGANASGEDITQFLCSGRLTFFPTSSIVGIFPTTPPSDWK